MDKSTEEISMPTNQDIIRTVETYSREMASKIVHIDKKIDRYHKCTDERLCRLETDVSELKTDVSELKTDVSELKTDVSELKTDVSELKTDVSEIKEILLNGRAR